jgi:hypothetical protein
MLASLRAIAKQSRAPKKLWIAFAFRLQFCVFAMIAMLAPERAFADSAIDRSVKPYFVLGGGPAALVFLGIGLFLLSRAIHFRRLAAAAVHWPTTEGTVIATDVIKRVATSDDDYDRYVPHVSYAYTANGVGREGNVIRIGLGDLGYLREEQAREHLARYPLGATIAVRYDPQKREQATLEVGRAGAARYFLAGTLLAGVGVGALVFAIWSASLPVR